MSDLTAVSDAEFDAVQEDRLRALQEAQGTPHFGFALARCEALQPIREARYDALKALIEKLESLA